MKIDGFVLAMLAAVVVAIVAPGLGASEGPLHLSVVTGLGVSLVFFLHGAALAPQALKAGAANWRLHLLIHGATFLLFPALGLAIFLAAGGVLPSEARLGIFFLCALSSTISSSVAMTALARGNVAGAVFNATLSGLIGMLITPFLVGLVTVGTSAHIALGPAVLDIALKLLAPFLVGQLARPLIGGLIARRKPWVAKLDRSVIVLIVYNAFCDSTLAGVWSRYDPLLIAGIALLMGGLVAGVIASIIWAARALRFSREDEAAAVFCGGTKSLANGAPIAAVLFAGHPALGMILLPLMIYHQLQLIACSMLARRYAERADQKQAADPAPA
jgi:sodium/bile acid cotransporter 7